MIATTLDTMRRLLGVPGRGLSCAEDDPAPAPGADLIYRLKAWPRLPEAGRTADVYRMLSVMSSRPLNRQWILANTRIEPQQLDDLLRRLAAEGSVEVIDPARFAGREACRAA